MHRTTNIKSNNGVGPRAKSGFLESSQTVSDDSKPVNGAIGNVEFDLIR